MGRSKDNGTFEWTPESTRGKSLFYLLRRHSTYEAVPFTGVPYSIKVVPEKGFPLDIYPARGANTWFCFVPDMNDDGYCELFVSGHEGFLYGVGEHGLVPLRGFYYGMRE